MSFEVLITVVPAEGDAWPPPRDEFMTWAASLGELVAVSRRIAHHRRLRTRILRPGSVANSTGAGQHLDRRLSGDVGRRPGIHRPTSRSVGIGRVRRERRRGYSRRPLRRHSLTQDLIIRHTNLFRGAHVTTLNSGSTAPSSGGNASDLIATLLHRAPRLATAMAAGRMAWPAVQHVREQARERTTYTVKVLSTDAVYDDLHEWVLGMLPAGQQRALVAWTSKGDRSGPSYAPEESPTKAPPRLRLRYDGSREQTVSIGGHPIKVVVSDGEAGDKDGKLWKPDEIVFTASSLAAQRRLLDEISSVAQTSHETLRKPVFRMLNKWGDWQRLDDLPDRDLDSVILADGQLERLIADVADFLGREADYVRRCVPWHRGHLYEGPPGTGKTSVARAIASHFNMDIWYLPLADVQKDCDLLNVINRITPRSMLLLEDADVFHALTQRNEGDGVTLSGLLNALDGIATPHGLLTVLTTNTPEILDRAVVRPGRVDLVEHFGPADRGQVARLLQRWYGHPVEVPAAVGVVSPAQVVEACKRNVDAGAALTEISRVSA